MIFSAGLGSGCDVPEKNPVKAARGCAVPTDKRLKCINFSGEIQVMAQRNGKVLVTMSHDDGRIVRFEPKPYGWEVA